MIRETIAQLRERKKELRAEIARLEKEIRQVQKAVRVLAKLKGPAVPCAKPKRKMSAAARAKIAAYQKARWAKIRAQQAKNK